MTEFPPKESSNTNNYTPEAEASLNQDNENFFEIDKETSSKFTDHPLNSILKGLTSQFQYEKVKGEEVNIETKSDYIPINIATVDKMNERNLLSQYTVNLRSFYSRINKLKNAEQEFLDNRKKMIQLGNKNFNDNIKRNQKHLDVLNGIYNLFDFSEINKTSTNSSLQLKDSVLNLKDFKITGRFKDEGGNATDRPKNPKSVNYYKILLFIKIHIIHIL
jgi:hypothetical protein